MLNKFNFYSLLIISFFLVSSCSNNHKFIIAVNSVSNGEPFRRGVKYAIVSSNTGVTEENLQFQDYKEMIDKVLQKAGYQPAKSNAEAEIIISLYYNISDPKEEIRSYSTPIFGETGISSSNTTSSVQNNRYSIRTVNNPTYGVTGYMEHTEKTISYTKTLILTAEENHKESHRVWKVKAESAGPISDLRAVFPALLIATKPYIGRNSHKRIMVKIMEDDKRINVLSGYVPVDQ